MNTRTQPMTIEVAPQGHIALSSKQVRDMGFKSGDRLMLIPFENGQFLLMQPTTPAISRQALSKLLQNSFHAAGYKTEESILDLIRDVKREMVQQ